VNIGYSSLCEHWLLVSMCKDDSHLLDVE